MAEPYLPVLDITNTSFPRADWKDVQQQVRLVNGKYRRIYPELPYYPLLRAPTAVASPGDLSGEPGTTAFDPIWGEPIAPGAGQKWEQPHGSSALDATSGEVFGGPYPIHCRVQLDSKDLDLKKYGFDKVRDITVWIPLSLLDEQGVRVNSGDNLEWNSRRFVVKEFTTTGWWRNTNVPLFMVLTLDHARLGS